MADGAVLTDQNPAAESPAVRSPLPSIAPKPRRSTGSRPKTLLIFSQTFVPDPAAVGQYVAEVAAEMGRRGHRVRVYTANRGYDDPTARYPASERWEGVKIRRLPLSSFGKRTIFTRVLGTATFMLQCLLIGLFTPNVAGIFFSTSPPLVGIVASVVRIFRDVPLAYWAMDLNPDQLIALGKISPHGFAARVLEAANRLVLRRADLVVALDRYMADRLKPRIGRRAEEKILILPPWPHEEHIDEVPHEQNPFRSRHGLHGKFVVMYSGNHSPSNPLTTLLEAAVRLKNDPRIRFVFVGGGGGKGEVEAAVREYRLTNVLSLPYQPLSELKYSLSAADVHVVSLGSRMVGVIHPCKVYGAMNVARPVLYFGPRPSHISDLLEVRPFGVQVPHGDVDEAIREIQRLSAAPPDQLRHTGEAGRQILEQELRADSLRSRLCDALEKVMRL